MVQGIIGRKLGMTQIFEEDGRVVPVTVLSAGPCVIVQVKTPERDGYSAAQVGLVEEGKPDRHANKPRRGHFEKAGVPPTRVLRELPLAEGSEAQPGEKVLVEQFAVGGLVDVIGRSKGRGFQGVVKRHGFGGGRATHGSMFHRAPGSIGQSAYPSRVFKGMRGPGHMGDRRVTVKNLEVVRVDAERNLLVVRGAVPGGAGSLVTIRPALGAAPAASE
jgi:large subunit ribosomal protein L3